jgi:hypothetical protein
MALVDAGNLASRDRYRPARRGEAWRAVSMETRVVEAQCAGCGRHLSRPGYLEAAHLVAERELFALGGGVRARYLCDRRGVVPLCRRCHAAFDVLVVGVRDPGRLGARRLKQLERWHARHAAGFRRLVVRRMRWLAVILAETDGAETDGTAVQCG